MNNTNDCCRDLQKRVAELAMELEDELHKRNTGYADLLHAGTVAMEAMDAAKHQIHGREEFRPVWAVLDTAIGQLGNKLLKYGDHMGNIGQTPPFALRQLQERLKVRIQSTAPQQVRDFLRSNGYGWMVDDEPEVA